MADDHSQRPYRSSESIARAGQGKASAAGNDPLAELARLIGQSDPFGEFSRENARRAEAQAAPYAAQVPSPAAAPQGYAGQDHYAVQPAQSQYYGQQNDGQQFYAQPAYGQQAYEQQPYETSDAGAMPYPTQQAGYEHAEHYPANPPYSAEDHEFYDDVPPSRRRMGVMVVAGVFALAVVGTAGAFGYRAVFGSSGAHSPPPVIKAETAPSKIVPAAAKDAQSNKLITDRIAGPQGEKVVSREEQPVERPPLAPDNTAGNSIGGSRSASLGSGVVTGEAKKIRTIAIHPDQLAMADGAPAGSSPMAAAAAEPPTRASTPPQRTASAPQAEPAPRQVQSQPVRPQPQAAEPAPAADNAPLSLNPNVQAPRASAPARTASVAPTQAAPSAGGTHAYAVQVSSQRSEADAQAAYRSLQGKFAAQLSGKQYFIHKVDLGAKGTYYRAMVGPYVSANEASELCSGLKAAGGQCIVQRN